MWWVLSCFTDVGGPTLPVLQMLEGPDWFNMYIHCDHPYVVMNYVALVLPTLVTQGLTPAVRHYIINNFRLVSVVVNQDLLEKVFPESELVPCLQHTINQAQHIATYSQLKGVDILLEVSIVYTRCFFSDLILLCRLCCVQHIAAWMFLLIYSKQQPLHLLSLRATHGHNPSLL